MEENSSKQYSTIQDKNRHVCFENHCWKQCLAMVIASFIGGFLAFYFVLDQAMLKHHNMHFRHHKYERNLFDDIDRMYKQDMKAFEDAFDLKKMKKFHQNNDFMMPLFMSNTVKIKTEYDDDKFNIIIGLKPFQNDENKIQYEINGRKLTVLGSSKVMDKNYEHDVAFSQDFILPENADLSNITKVKSGNKIIITVPIKE